MNSYFSHVSKELLLQISQIREFIKNHGPSVGAFNEEILREFLKKHLPKWVTVAHGFVLDNEGNMSNQNDILIYNSTFYSPIYSVNEMVVLPPEAVIFTIEIKTSLNQKNFSEIFPKTKTLKNINPEIESLIFIYQPPSSNKIFDYLNKIDFSEFKGTELPDKIYGLNKFYISKENIQSNGKNGVGYIEFEYEKTDVAEDVILEQFYYDIYRRIEIAINKDMEKGIDNAWHINESIATTNGRVKYSNVKIKGMTKHKILISK